MKNTLILCQETKHKLVIEIISALKKSFLNVELQIISDDKYCIGCFNCWLKTPGKCIHKDNLSKTVLTLPQKDVLILLTPIMYGGYDTQMKNFLDRSIPNILPFFRNYKNEVHHEVRYKNYPKIITIGYSENLIEEEKNIFFQLIERNALNTGNPDSFGYIVTEKEEINELINILQEGL